MMIMKPTAAVVLINLLVLLLLLCQDGAVEAVATGSVGSYDIVHRNTMTHTDMIKMAGNLNTLKNFRSSSNNIGNADGNGNGGNGGNGNDANEVPSFDGDLDAILQLALDEAARKEQLLTSEQQETQEQNNADVPADSDPDNDSNLADDNDAAAPSDSSPNPVDDTDATETADGENSETTETDGDEEEDESDEGDGLADDTAENTTETETENSETTTDGDGEEDPSDSLADRFDDNNNDGVATISSEGDDADNADVDDRSSSNNMDGNDGGNGDGLSINSSSNPPLSDAPSLVPTSSPTTVSPTVSPTPLVVSDMPSLVPSSSPSSTTDYPTATPTMIPSDAPTLVPTPSPTRINNIVDGGDGDGDESAMLSDAPSLVPSDAPSLVPSDAPSLVPSQYPSSVQDLLDSESSSSSNAAEIILDPIVNPHACTDMNPADTTTYMLIITYLYSIETVKKADPEVVVGESEEILQEMIAPNTLYCLSTSSTANTDQTNANIAALDSRPRDKQVTDQTCYPQEDLENHDCTLWTGKMRFFVTNSNTIDEAATLATQQIRDVIDSDLFVDKVGTGLVNATFIEALDGDFDSDSSIGAIDAPDAPVQETAIEGGSLGLTSVVLVTFAGAALVVMVGSVYYWRHSYGRGAPSGAATTAAGTSMLNNTTTTDSSGGGGGGDLCDPNNNNSNGNSNNNNGGNHSPYSAMVSDAYRFNENMSILSGRENGGMSAIMEDEEHSQTSSQILLSDAGYSTEAGATETDTETSLLSMDVPKSLYTSVPPESPDLLGARRRTEMIAGDDMSDLEASDVDEMSSQEGGGSSNNSSPARFAAAAAANRASSSAAAAAAGNLLLGSDSMSNSNNPNNNTSNNGGESPDDSMAADDMLLFC